MSEFDVQGLAAAIAIGSLISGLGIGTDRLLLSRQSEYFDDLALRWWNFFDNLRIVDIPRESIQIYLSAERYILGKNFGFVWLLRALIVSSILTFVAIPGGRALGMFLSINCVQIDNPTYLSELPFWNYFSMGWSFAGFSTLQYLIPLNLVFDALTIFLTVYILKTAILKSDYLLICLIVLDLWICILLFYNAFYIADQINNTTVIATEGYFRLIPSAIEIMNWPGCGKYHIFTSTTLFVSTILLPTLLYLIMIVFVFLLRETFKVFKLVAMHLFEKSVEDQKTVFAHVGVFVGLFVSGGKLILELIKIA